MMKRLICILLLLCLVPSALAAGDEWLLMDGLHWGMTGSELYGASADAFQMSDTVFWMGDVPLGGTDGSMICCLNENALYFVSLDYAAEDVDAVLDTWLAALTERFGLPEGGDKQEAASVMTANSNMTGGTLDFDDVKDGMSCVNTWHPTENTFAALFLYDETELCVIMADETVIFPTDEKGNVKQFGM